MNYCSVSSLFKITNTNDATQYLEAAKRQLQAAESECYFNSYLKKYNMQYVLLAMSTSL